MAFWLLISALSLPNHSVHWIHHYSSTQRWTEKERLIYFIFFNQPTLLVTYLLSTVGTEITEQNRSRASSWETRILARRADTKQMFMIQCEKMLNVGTEENIANSAWGIQIFFHMENNI